MNDVDAVLQASFVRGQISRIRPVLCSLDAEAAATLRGGFESLAAAYRRLPGRPLLPFDTWMDFLPSDEPHLDLSRLPLGLSEASCAALVRSSAVRAVRLDTGPATGASLQRLVDMMRSAPHTCEWVALRVGGAVSSSGSIADPVTVIHEAAPHLQLLDVSHPAVRARHLVSLARLPHLRSVLIDSTTAADVQDVLSQSSTGLLGRRGGWSPSDLELLRALAPVLTTEHMAFDRHWFTLVAALPRAPLRSHRGEDQHLADVLTAISHRACVSTPPTLRMPRHPTEPRPSSSLSSSLVLSSSSPPPGAGASEWLRPSEFDQSTVAVCAAVRSARDARRRSQGASLEAAHRAAARALQSAALPAEPAWVRSATTRNYDADSELNAITEGGAALPGPTEVQSVEDRRPVGVDIASRGSPACNLAGVPQSHDDSDDDDDFGHGDGASGQILRSPLSRDVMLEGGSRADDDPPKGRAQAALMAMAARRSSGSTEGSWIPMTPSPTKKRDRSSTPPEVSRSPVRVRRGPDRHSEARLRERVERILRETSAKLDASGGSGTSFRDLLRTRMRVADDALHRLAPLASFTGVRESMTALEARRASWTAQLGRVSVT